MRIFCLANGELGLRIVTWLREHGEEIVGMAVHPYERARGRAEIVRASGVPEAHVLDGSLLDEESALDTVRALRPDIALSVFFGYILRESFLSVFPKGVVNLHTGYLPYNRGAYPGVWSIIDETPAGVSLHYVDAGVDTGDIVAQAQVPVRPCDTGASLYRRLEDAAADLFIHTWPALRAGDVSRQPQPPLGTTHRRADVQRVDAIDLDRTYRARELINVLRARTFPPHPGAYFVANGRRVYMRLELTEATDD